MVELRLKNLDRESLKKELIDNFKGLSNYNMLSEEMIARQIDETVDRQIDLILKEYNETKVKYHIIQFTDHHNGYYTNTYILKTTVKLTQEIVSFLILAINPFVGAYSNPGLSELKEAMKKLGLVCEDASGNDISDYTKAGNLIEKFDGFCSNY